MTRPCPETEEWQGSLNGLTTLLNENSPVAFAIIAASILEDQVLQTLKKIAPGIEKRREITHCLRVQILRDMGLITEPIAKGLKSYSSIRNRFAHRPHTTTFDDPEIAKFTRDLKKQLELESGMDWLARQTTFLGQIDHKYHQAGGRPRWTHEVAKTLIGGYMSFTFYLIWARYWAPTPQTPKGINEIGKHECAEKKLEIPEA